MVEIIKIGNKTLVMDGKILSLFRKGSLLRQMWYGGYEDFDGANGGVWKKYINIPVTTIPSEYAQYLIEIDDTNDSVYNVEGTLKAQASIASEFWSLVRSDGFDIRVFDHLFNQLWFWVEEFDYANKKAKIWVKLPENSEELNIAFGNEKASESLYNNGGETLEFLDDFEDRDISDWLTYNGVWTAENGYLEQLSTDVNGYRAKHSEFSSGRDIVIEAKVYIHSNIPTGIVFAQTFGTARDAVNGYLVDACTTAMRLVGVKDNTWGALFKISKEISVTEGWHTMRLIVRADGYIKGEVVGVDYLETTDTTYSTGGVGVNVFDGYGGWDNVKVLKFADPATFGTPRIIEF